MIHRVVRLNISAFPNRTVQKLTGHPAITMRQFVHRLRGRRGNADLAAVWKRYVLLASVRACAAGSKSYGAGNGLDATTRRRSRTGMTKMSPLSIPSPVALSMVQAVFQYLPSPGADDGVQKLAMPGALRLPTVGHLLLNRTTQPTPMWSALCFARGSYHATPVPPAHPEPELRGKFASAPATN